MNLRAFLKFFPKQVRKSADFCDNISERRDAASKGLIQCTTVRVATAVLSRATQSAFDELMDAYRDRLIFFIKGYVGSAEEAQDIAMDTFVEILVHPGRFRFKSSFKTYIYSVARHKAVDFLRKKRTVPDSGKEIWDESAIDSFYRREDARTVRECMDRLNGDYRTVLYLVYFEEVDGDGAAKIMGKSKKQLANLLYRAKQALKTELEKEGFCYEDR